MFQLFAILRGYTPAALVRAALGGHLDKVEHLLDVGVPIDSRDETGGTALMAAATRGRLDVLACLIKRGAHVDAMVPNGSTALSMAANAGDPAGVEILLAANAEPNAASVSGVTPVMLAAKSGSLAVVRSLIAAGADVRSAVRSSVRIKEEPGDILGFTALAFAVLRDHAEIVRTLRAHGAKLNPSIANGLTLLALATLRDSQASARMLLNLGVDPNEPSRQGPYAGKTAMELATEQDNREIVALLSAHGAEVTGTRLKQGALQARRTG